jgi:hypothetical protein
VGTALVANVGAATTGAATTGAVTPQRRMRQRSNKPTRGATTTTGAGATTGAKATVGVGHDMHCASASAAAVANVMQHAAAKAARTDIWVMF